MELTLPYPPGVNHLYGIVHGRKFLKKAGRLYHAEVASLCMVQLVGICRPLLLPLAVWLTWYPPDARRRDIDGPIKACLDALQKAGVYGDDVQIKELHLCWREKVVGGKVAVRILELRKE